MSVHLTCSVCSGAFVVPPVRANTARFCSQACALAGRIRPLEDRFWERVKRDGPVPSHCPELGRCWEWTGSLATAGYGSIGLGGRSGRTIGAHVASYRLNVGNVPPGLCVLHRCDYRPCVNPAHLFVGSKADNNADMRSKGRDAHGSTHGTKTRPDRVPRGERHGVAKLTAESVAAIRDRYATGGVTMMTLAEDYGVKRPSISLVLSRKRWGHVK